MSTSAAGGNGDTRGWEPQLRSPSQGHGPLAPMGEVRGRNENAKPGRTLYSCGVLSPVIKGQSLQRSTS